MKHIEGKQYVLHFADGVFSNAHSQEKLYVGTNSTEVCS